MYATCGTRGRNTHDKMAIPNTSLQGGCGEII